VIKTEDDDGDDDDLDFCFTSLDREKKGTAGKEKTKKKKKKKRERAPLLFFTLSLSLLLCFSTLSLFSRARESFSPLGFSFVRSFDIRLLTKQQQLFLFENKMQNNAKRSPRRRNTSRNSRTKRAGRICSSY
jgi:hypothetical protein